MINARIYGLSNLIKASLSSIPECDMQFAYTYVCTGYTAFFSEGHMKVIIYQMSKAMVFVEFPMFDPVCKLFIYPPPCNVNYRFQTTNYEV